MNKFEAPQAGRTEQLVERVFDSLFGELSMHERMTFDWANQVLDEYNNLPKGNNKERNRARGVALSAARQLLNNPQNIDIARSVWNNHASQEEAPLSFYGLVKQEAALDTRKNWEKVSQDQLSELLWVFASDTPSRDFGRETLTSYFIGPGSKHQRVEVFSSLVYSVLDLVGDDNAFDESVRIALFGTDILSKDPYLIEQALILSMPYGEDEDDFKKLIIAKNVLNQISSLRPQEFDAYHMANGHYVREDEKAKREWNKKRARVTKEIGRGEATEFNNIMMDFFRASQRPLSEAMKKRLKADWPYCVVFDETDPLNQKFERVKAQLASSA